MSAGIWFRFREPVRDDPCATVRVIPGEYPVEHTNPRVGQFEFVVDGTRNSLEATARFVAKKTGRSALKRQIGRASCRERA